MFCVFIFVVFLSFGSMTYISYMNYVNVNVWFDGKTLLTKYVKNLDEFCLCTLNSTYSCIIIVTCYWMLHLFFMLRYPSS
jgi:hypothetical protein